MHDSLASRKTPGHGAPKDKRALIAVSFVLLLFFLYLAKDSPGPVLESRLFPPPLLLVSTSTKLGMDEKWMKGTILL